ncbi:MAG TPA: sulfite exporter TauE/SafE family protein [Alphaproteobacteria bacterium]|nr:sulfite exporter TauE/SafE family protein [Alphaproteobacteria bacterium]
MDFDIELWMTLLPALAVLGLVAGFLAGLLGVGGGIVLVPGLFYIFSALGFPEAHLMHVCVGTSLAVIVPTGLSSALAHHKRGNVDTYNLKTLGIGTVIGVGAGTVLADSLSSTALQYVFAVVILLLAALMVISLRKDIILRQSMPPQPFSSLMGAVVGVVSTLVGIGGATMNVPFMTMCKVPIHKAIGTSSALGLFISIPAVIGFVAIGWGESGVPPYSLGFVNIPAFLLIVPLSVLAAKWGAAAAHKASVPMMRKVFAFFLVLVSLKLWSDLL